MQQNKNHENFKIFFRFKICKTKIKQNSYKILQEKIMKLSQSICKMNLAAIWNK